MPVATLKNPYIENRDADDQATIATIHKVCDVAAENGLEVVLYPHFGYKIHTSAECERFRKLADRPNLGISFSLCHFLCQENSAGMDDTLPSAKAIVRHGVSLDAEMDFMERKVGIS